jgi:hypothetical protein
MRPRPLPQFEFSLCGNFGRNAVRRQYQSVRGAYTGKVPNWPSKIKNQTEEDLEKHRRRSYARCKELKKHLPPLLIPFGTCRFASMHHERRRRLNCGVGLSSWRVNTTGICMLKFKLRCSLLRFSLIHCHDLEIVTSGFQYHRFVDLAI